MNLNLAELQRPAYYYRSSLCHTLQARAACAELERSAALELVEERALPARPSMRWDSYTSDPLRVALFRIK